MGLHFPEKYTPLLKSTGTALPNGRRLSGEEERGGQGYSETSGKGQKP